VKKTLISIIMLLLIGLAERLQAQVDPHFSQYYAYPLWLNPALTGVIDGDMRLTGNFKEQWPTINKAYKTGALSADFRSSEKVGIGFNIINQAAGTAGYNYFAAYGSFGYGISISPNGYQKLHFGLQAGVINRSFDPNKLQFDNQYGPINGFDPNVPNFENFTTTSATVFDANVGVFYDDEDPLNTANVFGGVSIAHLNRVKDPFTAEGVNSKLPVRYTIHGGVRVKASEFFDITPHAIYIKQQKTQIRALGIYSELKVQDDQGLILGGMYRLNDAFVADAGYHFKNMVIGVSYDFNSSALSSATSGQGGIELSVSYILGKGIANPARVCPRF
jgi:type IX secretion system PorP/SprF family membrane protein